MLFTKIYQRQTGCLHPEQTFVQMEANNTFLKLVLQLLNV